MDITLFDKCVFEFIGTMIMILLGDGVCAACTLEKSKAKGAGWIPMAGPLIGAMLAAGAFVLIY